MARRLSIGFNWQGSLDYDEACRRVRAADEAGVDTVWVPEAWGRDCFTILAILARETERIQLGTGIVNTYSRTPAALAQHFATLDEVSNGRMIIGLGTSGYRVIEHWHGVPFQPPLTRLREYVEILRIIFSGEPLRYEGKVLGAKFSWGRTGIAVKIRYPFGIIHIRCQTGRALPCYASATAYVTMIQLGNRISPPSGKLRAPPP